MGCNVWRREESIIQEKRKEKEKEKEKKPIAFLK